MRWPWFDCDDFALAGIAYLDHVESNLDLGLLYVHALGADGRKIEHNVIQISHACLTYIWDPQTQSLSGGLATDEAIRVHLTELLQTGYKLTGEPTSLIYGRNYTPAGGVWGNSSQEPGPWYISQEIWQKFCAKLLEIDPHSDPALYLPPNAN